MEILMLTDHEQLTKRIKGIILEYPWVWNDLAKVIAIVWKDDIKIMLKMAIDGARRNNIKIGICGQAPSDYPEMAKFLIEQGIDSMSLNPDTVVKTILMLGDRS